MERKEDALERGAKADAEILSCALGSDTGHPTRFLADGSSIAWVMQRAIQQAKIAETDIDYVNLHGTGTRVNDLIETRAMKKVFGKKCYELSSSSTKSSTGHLLGSAGSVEAGLSCLAIRDQFIPPTANLEQRDPECDLDYTPLKGRLKAIRHALSISFGFGGPISAIILRDTHASQ